MLLLCGTGALYFWLGDGGAGAALKDFLHLTEEVGETQMRQAAGSPEVENAAQSRLEEQEASAAAEPEDGVQAESPADAGEGAVGESAGTAEESPAQEESVVFGSVEDDYFEDALFLGDSRTVGMYEYGELEEIATFYASTGMTVYKLFEEKLAQFPGEKEPVSVEEALTRQQFGKIYLMLGINEMGRGTVESFTEVYAGIIEHLQELQPDAVIYIQAIMKVTTERSHKGDYITNEGIEERNKSIAELADGERVFFLDVNPVVCAADGGLTPEYTTDGVHLKAKYIGLWKDYLKENAVLTGAG